MSRGRIELGVCVDVGFGLEAFLDSPGVSLDDRRGVSALGPLIDGGCGLESLDRVRCGETRTSTFDVEEATPDMCASSETASEYRWRAGEDKEAIRNEGVK